jgi:hypothetical protein
MIPTCAYTVQLDNDGLDIECPCEFETDAASTAHGLAIAQHYLAQLAQEVAA